jgi:hypothetical protein
MPKDDAILAGEWEEPENTEVEIETPEPSGKEVATRPEEESTEVAEATSREDLELEAAREGELDVLLDDLTGKDLTIEDLRSLPDAEGFSDEELVEMAVEAGLIEAPEKETTGKEVATTEHSWRLLDPKGNDVTKEALGMTVGDFIAKGGLVGYKAMNTQQARSFDELVRLAQLGHLNETKVQQLVEDRGILSRQAMALAEQVRAAQVREQQFHAILADTTGVSFLKAQEAYMKSLANPAPVATEAPEVQEARGLIWYQQNVMPALQQMASVYGADVGELDKLCQYLIGQEPKQLLTVERVKQIVNVMLPNALETAGYVQKPRGTNGRVVPSIATRGVTETAEVVPSVNTPRSRTEELRLRAENANLKRALSKQKLGKAPGAGNRGAPPLREATAVDRMEKDLDGMTAQEAREYLRGLR